jgi:hypothetical protein
VEAECEKSRDQVDPVERANTGYLAPPQEISAVRRLIGGAMRTRNNDPKWRAVDTNTAYIERGSPSENGHIESFAAV